jgi:phosphatidyl-myo-inositol dimannoside synthase
MASASLNLDGGGAALLSRLVAVVASEYCREIDVSFQVFHAGHPTDVLSGIKVRHFHGNLKSLALALWHVQLSSRNIALMFDHLGPSRVQAYLPSVCRSPYLLLMLGIEVWRPMSWDRRRALENALKRLSISEHTLERARSFSPWLPLTDVLHLTLENREPSGECDEALLERLGTDYLLIVGRMPYAERYKGHDELIKAMPHVLQQCPNARLVIVGKGDDQSRLERMASEQNVREEVIFTGFVTETTLNAIYRRCRAFVMPSRNEGFGLVYLEAMRVRKPCLALRGFAAEEIIQDGVTGILVDDGDSTQLTNALTRLLSDSEFANSLGTAGYQKWEQQFSYAIFRNKVRSYLKTLMEQ